MIKYALQCAAGHRFEAWFRNADACDAQLAAELVSCPSCARTDISKALMAPSIAAAPRGEAPSAAVVEGPEPAAPPPPSPDHAPSAEGRRRAIEERLRAMRAEIEAKADNVGEAFAEEARRIHDGEAEERAIYGDATAEEVEELLADDIPVAPLPWIDRRDD